MFVHAAKILYEDYNNYDNSNFVNNNENKGEKLKTINDEEGKKRLCCGKNWFFLFLNNLSLLLFLIIFFII